MLREKNAENQPLLVDEEAQRLVSNSDESENLASAENRNLIRFFFGYNIVLSLILCYNFTWCLVIITRHYSPNVALVMTNSAFLTLIPTSSLFPLSKKLRFTVVMIALLVNLISAFFLTWNGADVQLNILMVCAWLIFLAIVFENGHNSYF